MHLRDGQRKTKVRHRHGVAVHRIGALCCFVARNVVAHDLREGKCTAGSVQFLDISATSPHSAGGAAGRHRLQTASGNKFLLEDLAANRAYDLVAV